MLISLKSLIGYRLHAQDGYMGKVQDFHFDNRSWHVHHAAVSIHTHLPWPVVLLDPDTLESPNWIDRAIPVRLTRASIRHSMRLRQDPPLYIQAQRHAVNYNQWVTHWTPFAHLPEPETDFVPTDDVQLRSLVYLIGNTAIAQDGPVGVVEDFLADEQWQIPAVVIRLERNETCKRVMLNTSLIHRIDFNARCIHFASPQMEIASMPEYNALLSHPELQAPTFQRPIGVA